MKRILIFDDDQDILEVCATILEIRGHKVFTSDNCHQVEEKIRSYNPDIILMDNKVGNTNGVEATQHIKKTDHLRNIPVILFSANANIAELAVAAGAQGYLAKPFDISELTVIIDTLA
jgi:CheY-like chemotaxis protein